MTGATDGPPSRWPDALLAAQLFVIDPAGLGGVSLLAGPGPVRDLWFDYFRALLPAGAPLRKLPAGIEDDRLIGAVDLPATLAAGRVVLQKGLLAEADGGVLVIPMAERLSSGVAARIAGVLDRGALAIEREGMGRLLASAIGVVAFDEGAGPEERLPPALQQRFAFLLDLSGLSARGLDSPAIDPALILAARRLLPQLPTAPPKIVEALVGTAAAFGIDGVVAPLLALRVSRAAAALAGRREISDQDAAVAARLVLAPRARSVPAESPESQQQTPEEAPEETPPTDSAAAADRPDDQDQPEGGPSLEDLLLAAVQASLPEDLLAALKAGHAERQPSSRRQGSAAVQISLRRGRPAGVIMAALRPGARLALVETLRAAAPWQPVRQQGVPASAQAPRIRLQRQDIRLKRFIQRREATIIFCVDASGSAAFQRLAETKGAIELTLADAYAARTHVALVVFRGAGADLLLPATRSLSRAKALLASLPGGGGTPLASGLDAALAAAMAERARGRDPLIILLTDGRANIGRDGQPARPGAIDQAFDAARRLAAENIKVVFVDTAPRPRPEAASLAAAMAARYVALPYVEAGAVRDVALSASQDR